MKGSITSLFVRWITSPKEIREIADMLEKTGKDVSFTINTQIPIHIMVSTKYIKGSKEIEN